VGNLTVAAVAVPDLEAWLRQFARLITENKDYLTRLDSAIGDADHGINMDRGMQAVVAALDGEEFTRVSDLFQKVGMTLVSTVGGAAGPLYGTYFLRFGMKAGDVCELSAAALGEALLAGLEGVVARGKPEPGDKTMFDAMAPATSTYNAAVAQGDDLAAALRKAQAAAEQGRDNTIPMLAKKGRASYLGERSIGHQDPGATSSALLFAAAAAALA
jgi:dihydroxyacetone kinase-like protein